MNCLLAMELTERQKEILVAIIREYMRNADAVGSMNLVTKHEIGVSPATVRHEMVELEDKGYLKKAHLSSGRVPTDLGLKFFINELMEEEMLPNTEAVNVRIRVFKDRFDEERLMSRVLTFLSEETGCAAVSLVDETLRYRGISSLMGFPELRDVRLLEVLLRVLESNVILNKIFSRSTSGDVCVVIGKECDISEMHSCAIVFTKFGYFGDKEGYLGVIGPRRMRYSRVIPVVKEVGDMVENAVRGW